MKVFWIAALFLLMACFSNANGEDATAPATPTTIEELKKMPIKKLRQFLFARGLECRGCAEKEDFVKLAFENIDTPLKAAAPPAEEPEKSKEQKDKELADIMASLKSSGLGDGIKMFTKDDFAGLSPDQMAEKFGEGRNSKKGGRGKPSRTSKGGKGSSSSEDTKKTSPRPTSKPAKRIAEEEGDQIEL